jgi:effector-binding domain-containing protein
LQPLIEQPEIIENIELCVALIPVDVGAAQIRSVMHPTLAELRKAVADQGIEPKGPWLNHHLQRPGAKFVFELCLPTPRPVEPVGRMRHGVISARKVARTSYFGDFSGLPVAWGEFSHWIAAQGIGTRPDFWETYAIGPESGLPPDQWRTDFFQPLA